MANRLGRRSYRQIDGKMVEVTPTPRIPQGRMDSNFQSPVDGTIISTQKKLHEHNTRNNIEQTTEGHFQDWKQKGKERADFFSGNPAGKKERVEAIRATIEKLGV